MVDRDRTFGAGAHAGPGPEGWWNEFFTRDHARFQMALSEQTHDSDAETELLTNLIGISHGSRVLDAPCGQGRHAIRLAQKGAIVTGIDASTVMLQKAQHNAENLGIDVRWVHADMRRISWTSEFDCALCLGGSFGYFGRDGDENFLRALRRAVRPGGCLVLDIPSLEFISTHHQPVHESWVGGRRVVQLRHLDAGRGHARIFVTIETEHGPVSRTYFQQLYQQDQLCAMLTAAQFTVLQILDVADVAAFQSNRGHVLVLAARPVG